MQKFMRIVPLLFALLYLGCEDKTRFEGEILGHPDFNDCHALLKDENGKVLKDGEIVVRNGAEYEAFRKMFLNSSRDSCACSMPEVDFDRISILGKATTGMGNDYRFLKAVKIDRKAKKYIFSINVLSYESGGGHVLYMHYVYVPAIPKDFAVVFESD